VVAPLPGGRFVLAWEQDGAVWARVGDHERLGAPLRLSSGTAGQAHLDTRAEKIVATWSEQSGPQVAIRFQELKAGAADGALAPVAAAVFIDAGARPAGQLYPVALLTDDGVVVAWEDRRAGHTQIFFAHAPIGRRFEPPGVLNPIHNQPSVPFGRGTGAMRVSLARADRQRIVAVWLDKRDFSGGYDVYAAFSTDGGRGFGRARIVQDEFGSNIAQWHATVAGDGRGAVVVAWDDQRDDSADLWLSWPQGDGWSGDHAVPVAAGSGEQTHPAIALDGDGGLHVAWIDRASADGPTRIRYAFGRRSVAP
jgi:hypothetical protein